MNTPDFPKLLLKTVFSFMTCDGHISPQEMAFIKKMSVEKKLFGALDLDQEIDDLVALINRRGIDFLEDYFKKIDHAQLTEEQDLQLLEAAILTITADEKVKPEEISFLKILRTVLKSPDQKILARFPDLAGDFIAKAALTELYMKELYSNYFKQQKLPEFDISAVTDVTDNINLGLDS
jgi:uncharacterized tellurite resistance protein B-like protein